MANTRVTINEETEVEITLKVKFERVSFYGEMSKEELDRHVLVAKTNIKEQILLMVEDGFVSQQLSPGVYFDYEIENAKQ